jgi:hypothetical protein
MTYRKMILLATSSNKVAPGRYYFLEKVKSDDDCDSPFAALYNHRFYLHGVDTKKLVYSSSPYCPKASRRLANGDYLLETASKTWYIVRFLEE